MPERPRVGALGILSGNNRMVSCCKKVPAAVGTVGWGGTKPEILLPLGERRGGSEPGPLSGVRGDMVEEEAPLELRATRLLSEWRRWCARPLGADEAEMKLALEADECKGGLINEEVEPLLMPPP